MAQRCAWVTTVTRRALTPMAKGPEKAEPSSTAIPICRPERAARQAISAAASNV